MEFRKFLEMISETEVTEAKKKKPDADGDGVPDWADKKPGEDDHADKKDKKKKSLKDWIDSVEKKVISETSTIGAKPVPVLDPQTKKAAGAGVITSKNPSVDKLLKNLDPKDVQVTMTSQGSAPIGGTAQSAIRMEEEQVDEKWAGDAKVKPTGQYKDKSKEELKSMLAKLHKSGPHDKDSPAAKKMRQINFALRAKGGWKSGEGAAMKEESMDESGLQAYLGKKKYGEEGMKALQKAGREGASKEKMAKIRAQHDKLDEADKVNFWVHDEKDNKFYGPYNSETSAKEGGRVGKIKKFAANIRNPKSVLPSAERLRATGMGAAGGTKMNEKAVSKKQQKFMGMVHAAQKGEKAASPEVAKVAKSMKKSDVKDFAKTKHKGLPEKKKKANEADIPPNDSLMSPISESKIQVKEAMNTLEAAYHEGKSHGLSKHGYACRYNEGSEEHKRYHKGYCEGLDECYGMTKNPVVGETMPATVPGMASAAMPAIPTMEADLDEMNKTEYMKHKAQSTPGDTFKAFGQTMHDKDVLEADAFAFESLNKQLEDLLKEDKKVVSEGLSVNMSKGMGGMGEDTVSVSASGDDASKLLDFIKQVGLGGLGGAEVGHAEPEAAIVAVSDYGAPKYSGHDGMADLMKKVGVDDEEGADFKPEGGDDHEHSETCGCDAKKVDEVESADQRLYNVAEDDGEGYEQSQAAGAEIDSALAGAMGNDDVKVSEGGDGGEASEEPVMSEESKSEEDQHAEKAGKEVAKDIEHDEGHKGKDDNKAEKAGEKVTKDIEYDDKKDEKEKVDEWANDAGKKGTDAAFEEDINFMTKVISGGLNKPKATGQTTVPVIPGQDARIGESMDDPEVVQWKRLAGLA